MNYQLIYDNLIIKAKNEQRKKVKKETVTYVYYEKHHIIPRCLNGTNDAQNLVLLTAKEHYLAHKLLTYIYITDYKIASAFHRMTFDKRGKHTISARDYEYAKKIKSSIPQKSHYDIWLEKYGEEEAKRKEKEKKEKIKKTMTGVTYSEERRKKSGLGHVGLKFSEHTCLQKSKSMKGKNTGPRSEEIKHQISISSLGKKRGKYKNKNK